MNAIVKAQLERLVSAQHTVDGIETTEIPDAFKEIVFSRKNVSIEDMDVVRVEFENYILFPFEGFDFHDKFNNGIAPYAKVMYGKILKETEKMYYFDLYSETSDKHWVGWCPKKSCKIS